LKALTGKGRQKRESWIEIVVGALKKGQSVMGTSLKNFSNQFSNFTLSVFGASTLYNPLTLFLGIPANLSILICHFSLL